MTARRALTLAALAAALAACRAPVTEVSPEGCRSERLNWPVEQGSESQAAPPKRPRLILFVHGFFGGARYTWGRFPELLRADPAFADCDIASFDYPSTRSVEDIAALLEKELADCAARYQSVSLVGHSLGGIVARRVILDELKRREDNDWRIKDLLLFGVPERGTNLAKLACFFSASARQLDRDSEFLAALDAEWQENQERLEGLVEVVRVDGADDWVVPEREESQPEAEEIEAGHVRLAKPRSREDRQYQILKAMVFDEKASPSE